MINSRKVLTINLYRFTINMKNRFISILLYKLLFTGLSFFIELHKYGKQNGPNDCNRHDDNNSCRTHSISPYTKIYYIDSTLTISYVLILLNKKATPNGVAFSKPMLIKKLLMQSLISTSSSSCEVLHQLVRLDEQLLLHDVL